MEEFQSRIVKPTGNIIAAASRTLREEMQKLVSEGVTEIVIDMAQVELIDSTGIGVLIGIQNGLKAKNGRLKISHVSDDIRKMLVIMRLDKHIEIID